MPIESAEILAYPSYTNAEMLKLVRKAIADVLAGGQSAGLNGRTLTRADLKQLRDTEAYYETKIAAVDADTGGNIALVRFGDAR